VRFYAAVNGRGGAVQPVEDVRHPHVLISYALDPDLAILRTYTPESLLIDSGAFTVWTKGRTVDVDRYGEWCAELAANDSEQMRAITLAFVNLDVIPGEPRRPPTPAEVEHAASESMRNADRLRTVHGLPVMEVYHYGEAADVLAQLLARRRAGEVLGIGGSVGVQRHERRRWLDAVWGAVMADSVPHPAPICDDVRPYDVIVPPTTTVPPLHGLGCSNEELARRYPWWSVDSSTYTIPQRFGRSLNARGRQEFMATSGGTVTRRVKPAQRVEAIRILHRWQRLERDMTRAWAARGVRYAP
jgi:hypothetical protein